GVSIVVDSGFRKMSRFDPKSGLSRLETVRISQASAAQRTGRAGRLHKGYCYRMWSLATHNQLVEHDPPEIMEADLCNLYLELAMWGVDDISTLTWLTPPPSVSLHYARET